MYVYNVFLIGRGQGDGAPLGGDWILLSRQWIAIDGELALAHELLHIAGYNHSNPQQTDNFVQLERQCTGGRSAIRSAGNQY